MLLLVHTLTMTVADIEVSAKFFHVVCPITRRRHQGFVTKRVGVAWSRNKNKVFCGRSKFRNGPPHFHQNLQAMIIGPLQGNNAKPAGELQVMKASLGPPMPAVTEVSPNSDQTQGVLVVTATPQQTLTWLQTNQFSAYLHTFANFSGADLMRMSRDDLIQICGLADGIRLFNALHAPPPKAKTLYVNVQQAPVVYQAVYLTTPTSHEMCSKVVALIGLSLAQLSHVYMQGPNGIHVVITDELVCHIEDKSTFTTELMSNQPGDGLCLLLKPTLPH